MCWRIQDITLDNNFEEKLLADVIPCDEIGVKFDDIGALDNVKVALMELMVLPLQRPELFCKGNLTKVCLFSLYMLVWSFCWLYYMDI